MLRVVNNRITLTRGDTAELEVIVKDVNDKPYDCTGNKAYFRVKKEVTSRHILLEKELSVTEDGTLLLRLDDVDTEYLTFSSYKYEVELVTPGNRHYTIIEKGLLKIGPELENHDGREYCTKRDIDS